MQIWKCTSMYKGGYTSLRVKMYACLQVCKYKKIYIYSRMQLRKCAGMKVFKYANMLV